MAAKKQQPNTPLVAKQDDGTVQLTFTIAWSIIEKKREETAAELAKNIEVPGFRKGKAPVEKAKERLDPQFLLEKTLSQILPKLFADTISKQKIRPAMYPKFELISAKEGEDWQVRATTAEIPEFELGNYEKMIKDAKAADIWTPEKGDPKAKKEITQEQKENIAIQALENSYKFVIPNILIEEEINSRLASLLERLEKLGLSLESYLASIKKTAEELRDEYRAQAEKAIRLDILLGRIAEKENIKVPHEEVHGFIDTANASGAKQIPHEEESTISAFLVKRKVIDRLASMVA